MDVISSLPDEVLGRILSFLPTKRAGRTSILSTRWRYAFLSVSSLEFDYWDFRRGERNYWGTAYWSKYMNVLENFVDLQGNSSIKKLSLKCHVGLRDGIDPIRFRSWVCGVFDRGVVDLNLDVYISGNETEKYEPVPSMIFKSKILVKLRLARDFTIKLSPDDYLPMLKTLCLSSVDFNGDSLVIGTLISRCPVLEELVLENWMQRYNRWNFSVSSPSLKRLYIELDLTEGCIIFSYVPNLVYFELSCPLVCFLSNFSNFKFGSLVEARLCFYVQKPRLELSRNLHHIMSLVNAIRNVKVLHLSHSVLELIYLYTIQLPREFKSLVHLSLSSVEKQGWEILPLLIKNSPNLETIIFQGSLTLEEDKKDGYYCHDSCLSSSKLKVLEILGNHEGYSSDFKHMKPVLAKLPCLELLKICVNGNRWRCFELIMDMIPRASVRWNCKVQVIFEPTRDRESCLPRGSDTESNCLMF